jgi:type I restriction enzyme S subunit
MAGEWRQTTLGQVADFLSGGTPSKDVPQYWGGSIPWVSAKDMKRFRLDDTEDYVTDDGLANGTRLVPSGTVLLLARGMTLLNDVPICVANRPVTFNQDVKALRPKPGVRDDFLPYLLLGNRERLLNLVDLAGHGTGRLNSDELKALDVGLPPESDQRVIAHILGTLDDKIELNRRMNETLEAMARALFKSWFVDFDPVRAKAEGRSPGLPQPLADLFPDSFEDSELGETPKGWATGVFADLAAVSSGKRPEVRHSEASAEANVPLWGGNGPIAFVPRALIEHPILLTGRVGTLGVVFRITTPCWPSDNTLIVRTKNEAAFEYLFLQLRQIDFNSLNRGSTQPLLTQTDLKVQPLVLPPLELLAHFHAATRDLYRRVDESHAESRTLAALRDTLLPKLISGELRVKNTEPSIKEVTV